MQKKLFSLGIYLELLHCVLNHLLSHRSWTASCIACETGDMLQACDACIYPRGLKQEGWEATLHESCSLYVPRIGR
jgi:hypothetical protein